MTIVVLTLLIAVSVGAQGPYPIGVQFQVNSYTTKDQLRPAVAVDLQGNFVVAWDSNGSDMDTSSWSIQAQRYDSSGAPMGGQIQVNSYTTSGQFQPAVAVEPGGDFVVVWES